MTPKNRLKLVLPIVVLVIGIAGAAGMILISPDVTVRPPPVQPPLVRVVTAAAEDLQLRVRTQGTVEPRTETDLIPEVQGRVTFISPSLAAGGFFEEGELLLVIDKRDYEIALDRAEANLVRRESEARLARANLDRALKLSERGVLSASAMDEARNAARVADAAVRDAQATLEQAKLDLDRAEIRAPFAGRVRQENVDPGQVLVRGVPVAKLYAVDYAEIRLPVPDDQLAFLDVPLQYRGVNDETRRAQVELTVDFARSEHLWRGEVVRTEGEIDPQTRMVNVIARVDDPYGLPEDTGRPPLAVGMFVQAEILGRRLEDVVVLPRLALRSGDRVLIVDDENRMRFRDVDVVRTDREVVILRSGVQPGEQVCVSPILEVADGMQVRVEQEEGAV